MRIGVPRCRGVLLAACSAAFLLAGEASAVDTIETFEPGDVDLELYLGYEGLGLRPQHHGANGDLFLGYGLARRLSVYAGLLTQVDADRNALPDLYAGLIGTPFDSERLDFDLLLAFDALGPGLRELQVTPGVELNLDFDSRLGPWGAWLRVAMPVGDLRGDPSLLVELHPGLRWSPREGHELLFEYESALHPSGPEVGARLQRGGVAVGYNVALSDWLELVSQVSWALPETGDRGFARAMVGFISNPSALLAGR